MDERTDPTIPHVVIVGGGFGGLYAAQALRGAPVQVTLVDKRNFHLFQPLLYQVATGGISPADVASPLRAVLRRQSNARVLQAEVVDIDPQGRKVILADGELHYDSLVLAAGAENHYFAHPDWESQAPGLKTIEDAIEIRRRVLQAFEAAERQPDPAQRRADTTFVVIGGGPTGVELAGAIAELAHATLKGEFSRFDPALSEVILLEGKGAILPEYPAETSAKAQRALERLGVCVLTGALVEDIHPGGLVYRQADGAVQRIDARTVLWAAGMRASPLARRLSQRTGAPLDRSGRIMVGEDLSVPGYPEIYVLGDMAHCAAPDGKPLPGVAPVAMQQGRYAARQIRLRLAGKSLPAFAYQDKGSLAVIGRNAAVAVFGRLRIAGFPAWLAWVFIHIWYLIEFDNKLLVLIQWAWYYFTRKRGARLITGGAQQELGGLPALPAERDAIHQAGPPSVPDPLRPDSAAIPY
jgi:NADH dehydrogenase